MTDFKQNSHGGSDAQRANEARALLLRFTAHTSLTPPTEWLPAWSSATLEQAIAQIVSAPGGRMYHLLRGFWDLLSQTSASLSDAMEHFIKDIVVTAFTFYRSKYDGENFDWMVAFVNSGCTQAQAWYAMHALPEPWLESCRDRILSTLSTSPLLERAQLILSESD